MKKYHFEIFERMYNAHWFLSAYSCIGFVRDFPEIGGGDHITRFVACMETGTTLLIFDRDEFAASAEFVGEQLLNNAEWREKTYKKFYARADELFAEGERLRDIEWSTYSNEKIADEMESILKVHRDVRVLGVLLNGVIVDARNHLSDRIRGELRGYITEEFDEKWSVLTQVTKESMHQKKDRELSQATTDEEVRKIHRKYCWLEYMYQGPPSSLDSYEQEAGTAQHTDFSDIRREQEKLLKELPERAQFLVHLAQEVIWQKGWRKDVEYHAFYCYEPVFREIARRKRCNDWHLIPFILPQELRSFLLKDSPSSEELAERRMFSCLNVQQESYRIVSGKDAKKLYDDLGIETPAMSNISGQCAYAGSAKGNVKIIHSPHEMEKMEEGDILVSQATSPDILPAIKKAAAIVTNTGGLICHAAITARELKIPCVVGTVNATEALSDGDIVEVNATKGTVRLV